MSRKTIAATALGLVGWTGPARAGGSMSCVIPPLDGHHQRNGVETCYYDAAKKKKGSTSPWKKGKEVGPRRQYREDDGMLERVTHLEPNVGDYKSDEQYYETGGIRQAEFDKPGSKVAIEYTVSGKIHRVWCLPGQSGGYAYTLQECQPKVSFNLSKWRPAK